MHEKRRYGELVLHRVTAPMSNADAKAAAADIRMDRYRARIDTWQGQFAVWSDKGLSDTTMPPREKRASSGVRRGRRPTSTSAQRVYDEACKGRTNPPPQFVYEERKWGWKGTAWGATADKDRKRLSESYTKQGYDIMWLSFRGVPVLYIAKWKDGKRKPKYAPEEYTRASGFDRKLSMGIIKKLRGGKAPKTVTHKGKKWTLHSCHIRPYEAKSLATALSNDNHTAIFESGVGLYCIYIRPKSRKQIDKESVEQEVFSYLDRLLRAEVSRDRMPRVLTEMYGMSPQSALSFVKKWAEDRQLDVKPATHEHVKKTSKGVYKTKSEVQVQRERKAGRLAGPSTKSMKLMDISILGGGSSMVQRASNMLGISVDEVLGIRHFGNKNILIMVRIKNTIKIYELIRGKTKKTKYKFTERRLLDKFSTKVTESGIKRAFLRKAAERGVK